MFCRSIAPSARHQDQADARRGAQRRVRAAEAWARRGARLHDVARAEILRALGGLGASETAKAPLTKTAFCCGWAVAACELGSSLPILPDGVCWALSCCERCWASAGGGGCWAAEMPTLPANARAKAPVRKRSRRMIASRFLSA